MVGRVDRRGIERLDDGAEEIGQVSAHDAREVELVALSQHGEGVTATLRDRDGRDTTEAFSYAVGCDGGHSTVRALVGTRLEGSFDGEIHAIASAFAAKGLNDVIIRLGWEPNGDGNYPWSAYHSSPEIYKTCYRRQAMIIRSILPEATIDWTNRRGNGLPYSVETIYPGDDFVDVEVVERSSGRTERRHAASDGRPQCGVGWTEERKRRRAGRRREVRRTAVVSEEEPGAGERPAERTWRPLAGRDGAFGRSERRLGRPGDEKPRSAVRQACRRFDEAPDRPVLRGRSAARVNGDEAGRKVTNEALGFLPFRVGELERWCARRQRFGDGRVGDER